MRIIFLTILLGLWSCSTFQHNYRRTPASTETACIDLLRSIVKNFNDENLFSRDLSQTQKKEYNNYLSSTLYALEEMRGKNGLLADKAQLAKNSEGIFELTIINANTSPTNIGLDLLIQIQKIQNHHNSKESLVNITKILETLSSLDYHHESGLFFNWYSTTLSNHAVYKGVSSVDNIHLALALWTIKENFADTKMSQKANKLLERMDFSSFFDPETGLIKGQISYVNNKWVTDEWTYRNFGSEARSIYALVWALGLIKKHNLTKQFLISISKNIKMEVFSFEQNNSTKHILRTWDGGAFQQFLPSLILGEDRFSTYMQSSFQNYASFMMINGVDRNLPVPAGHSASNMGVDNTNLFGDLPWYNGKSGILELVSTDHVDVNQENLKNNWNKVFTPHAAFLAAASMPTKYLKTLKYAEALGTDNLPLYNKQFGWMDGYHVQGKYKGEVVPISLSLDNSMVALSIFKILSKDNLSPSSRVLQNNPATKKRLEYFYDMIDNKFEETVNVSE